MNTKEKQLAEKLRGGDTAALGEIIDSYTSYVWTVIRNFSRGCLSEQDIEELCSDVFYSLWKHRENLDIAVGFRSYLAAIARNAVKDRFKSAKPMCEDISELEIPSGRSAEDAAMLGETLRCVDEGLKTLSERDGELFTRYYFYGESTAELAQRFDISESTVRSALSRTRAKLKEFLTERGFDHA